MSDEGTLRAPELGGSTTVIALEQMRFEGGRAVWRERAVEELLTMQAEGAHGGASAASSASF